MGYSAAVAHSAVAMSRTARDHCPTSQVPGRIVESAVVPGRLNLRAAGGWRRSAKPEEYAAIVNTLAPAPTPVKAADIREVEVVRTVFREWWGDARFTKAALVLLLLMWIVFLAVRWIVRGFD